MSQAARDQFMLENMDILVQLGHMESLSSVGQPQTKDDNTSGVEGIKARLLFSALE